MPKRIGNLLPVMTDRNFIRGEMLEHAKKRMDDPTTVPALLHADECVAQVQHWIICGDWVPSNPTPHQARQAACRIGQLKHADMHHFRVKHVDGVISYRKIRKAIQNA